MNRRFSRANLGIPTFTTLDCPHRAREVEAPCHQLLQPDFSSIHEAWASRRKHAPQEPAPLASLDCVVSTPMCKGTDLPGTELTDGAIRGSVLCFRSQCELCLQ